MLTMLTWWYGRGWLWALHSIDRQFDNIGRYFAVGVLVRTWFAPWKQISSPSTFRNFFQSAVDNFISRLIGGIIRTTMLLIASVWGVIAILSGIILALIWPFLPMSVILLPVLYISGTSL
jgi:hypothetical protein